MVANVPGFKPLPPGEARSCLLHWRDEKNSAALYEGLAAQERKPKLARVFHHLAALEEGHAEVWAEKLYRADNRAFCKYACPVSVLLKVTSRPALLKVSGDAQACLECASQACTTLCPMDIEIPNYILAGKRVLSTECILCQHCVAVCPPNTLGLSFGFDLGGEDLLEERPQPDKDPRAGRDKSDASSHGWLRAPGGKSS